jgi:alpha-beta hydrolase superfamily lysophospholipase
MLGLLGAASYGATGDRGTPFAAVLPGGDDGAHHPGQPPAGQPGALISSEPLPAPDGIRAWRVLYHSRDPAGLDIAVSGLILAPGAGAAKIPADGRRVVAFGHGTTGINDHCAPSRSDPPLVGVVGTFPLVQNGYVVALTDYAGLGAAGEHAIYMAADEGRAMLDAARAAQNLPAADAGPDIVVWGYSQGGGAALAAGALAASYAPELRVHGVAATAPLADLPASLAYLRHNRDGVAYLLLAAVGLAVDDPSINLDGYLTDTGRRLLGIARKNCVLALTKASDGVPVSAVFTVDPLTTEPFAAGFARQRDAVLRRMPPTLVLQGDLDTVTHQKITDGVVAGLCTAGTSVDYRRYSIANHGTILPASLNDVVDWVADRFSASPPPVYDICALRAPA